MITIKDIQKLAELSRIKIAEEEQESLRTQIESILGYIDQIKEATQVSTKVSGGLTIGDGTLHNVLREDGEPHVPSEFTDKILSVAPAREGNYLKVKKIL